MSGSEPQPIDVFEVDHIRRLVELMEQHDLSEVDLRQNDQRIRLRRGAEPEVVSVAPAAQIVQAPASPATQAAPAPTEGVAEQEGEHIVLIKSPMVGTFYAKANPEADPYVTAGDHVDKDTTVCVIEAMKVFNEIPADVTGQIVAVLVENEEAVEFGRPLFKVDTSQ